MNSQQPREGLVKHIPLALLLTVLTQTSTGVWWAASLTQRVEFIEKMEARYYGVDSRLAVVENKIDGLQLMLRDHAQAKK